MPKVKIDGNEVEVQLGETLLEAAEKLGVPIPTLCSLDGSEPFTSCMLCVVEETSTGQLIPACSAPAGDGTAVRTNTDSVRAARRAALELLLAEHVGDCEAPCTLACPLEIDVPEVIRLLEQERIPEAMLTVRSATALPALACLLCPAPCEKACRRGQYDQPVAIGLLMRRVAASAGVQSLAAVPAAAEPTGRRVAVIGAGAAGLSAAYHLSLLGHGCTLFEAQGAPGGSLRDPAAFQATTGESTRLLVEREVDREMQILGQIGVEFRMNSPVAEAQTLGDIMDSHDALIAAAGPNLGPLLEQAGIRSSSRCSTSDAKVFAAGSLLEPGRSFVRALARGRAAAVGAHRYLSGEAVNGARERFQSHLGRLREGEIGEFLKGAADIARVIPRTNSGDAEPDPLAGYDRGEAAAEASRCLQCDCAAKESCRLRAYAEEYAVRSRHFRIGDRKPFRRILQHPRVVFEPGKCIKCGICVRIAVREKEQLGLAFLNRGYDLQVGVPFGEQLSRALERSADLCVRACPTGALAFRRRTGEEPKNKRIEP